MYELMFELFGALVATFTLLYGGYFMGRTTAVVGFWPRKPIEARRFFIGEWRRLWSWLWCRRHGHLEVWLMYSPTDAYAHKVCWRCGNIIGSATVKTLRASIDHKDCILRDGTGRWM